MKQTSNSQGVALMVLAMGLHTANDSFVKLSSTVLTTGQIMALRGVIVTGLCVLWMAASGVGRELPQLANRHVLLRSACEAATTVAFFIGLAHVPIADLTAVYLVTPLIMTAGAALIYKDTVSWQGWVAVVFGFAGVLLIVRPGAGVISAFAIFGLVSALFSAGRDLTTRAVKSTISSVTICTAAGIANMLMGIGLWSADVFGGTVSPLPGAGHVVWLYLLAAAGVVTIGNYGVILAFRYATTALVSPFRYTAIVWALLSGYAVWRDLPDRLALAGAAMIIAAGLYVLYHERQQRLKLSTLAATN